MTNTDRIVAELEREYPSYQVWTVPTWDGRKRGTEYCARRWDGTGGTLNARTPGELRQYIAQAEAK